MVFSLYNFNSNKAWICILFHAYDTKSVERLIRLTSVRYHITWCLVIATTPILWMECRQTLGVHFMQLSDLYVVGPCSFSLETMGLGQKCHCSFNRLLFGPWIKHKFQEPLESSLLLCRSCITPSLGKKGIASYKWIIVGKCFNSLTAKKQCFLECR